MFTLLTELDDGKRKHQAALQDLIKQTQGTVRIASAYVTDRSLLSGLEGRDIRLLTYLSRMDIVAGASSLDCLAALLELGVQCRYVSGGRRLHAKVYLFDNQFAVITSANLTWKALNHNLEVGVQLPSPAAQELGSWFDLLWRDKSEKLDLAVVEQLRGETEEERTEYLNRWQKVAKRKLPSAGPTTKIIDLFESSNRFFICNTNRRWSPGDEDLMHQYECAAAWEPFNYPGHMDSVEAGDAIFMFRKKVGIIAIGRAKGRYERLKANAPKMLRQSDTAEWRVPTAWLAWNANNAYKFRGHNSTFLDVSGDRYQGLRDAVRKHFLTL